MRVSTEQFVRAYLERIDYHGSTSPCLETLQELQRLHYFHVPYENLEMLKPGFAVNLDVDYLFDKVVMHQRGGVCFEVNTLFMHLLQALGFQACRITGTVNNDGEILTHAATWVQLPEGNFLADVSFGIYHMPVVKIAPKTSSRLDGWEYSVEFRSEKTFELRRRRSVEGWQTLCVMELTPRTEEDYASAYRWAAEPGRTSFTARPFCAFHGEHREAILYLCMMTVETFGDGTFQCPVPDDTNVRAYLREYFNLDC